MIVAATHARKRQAAERPIAAKPLFRRRFEVDCTVDVEHTTESLHAYVFLDGYEVGPGDEVTVKDPPPTPNFGGRVVRRCRATVVQAGLWGRIWTPVAAYLELTDLYEVGFDERSAS